MTREQALRAITGALARLAMSSVRKELELAIEAVEQLDYDDVAFEELKRRLAALVVRISDVNHEIEKLMCD